MAGIEVQMDPAERRRHRRLPLRFGISRVGDPASSAVPPIRTDNVSAGGMYFCAADADAPAKDEEVCFDLTVPPGQGYSPTGGTVRCLGTVVRAEPIGRGTIGVAVHFAARPALQF